MYRLIFNLNTTLYRLLRVQIKAHMHIRSKVFRFDCEMLKESLISILYVHLSNLRDDIPSSQEAFSLTPNHALSLE